MKKKIIILSGGYSKEKEISLDTGKEVYKILRKKYNARLFNPKGNLIKKLREFNPDVVFNALHGRYGEDGYIQSVLEFLKIKYTHSGVTASSKAIDKVISKKIFNKNNILTPKGFAYTIGEEKNKLIKKINKNLKFPVVIKPINEGSSVGVYICNKKNIWSNIKKLKDYKEILIEAYIPGKEIQSAIMGNQKLGSIELVPKRKFYDYKAKYEKKAKTKHIMPANISKKNYNIANKIALKAHKILNCRGISRSDFRFYKNKFYLLELNTQPGMTSLSLVPEIARYNNINFEKLLDFLVKDASINKI